MGKEKEGATSASTLSCLEHLVTVEFRIKRLPKQGDILFIELIKHPEESFHSVHRNFDLFVEFKDVMITFVLYWLVR